MPKNEIELADKIDGPKVRKWTQDLIQDITATSETIIQTMRKIKDGLSDSSITDEDKAALAGAIAGAVVRFDGPTHVYKCLHHCGLLDLCLHHFGHLLPRDWLNTPISISMRNTYPCEWRVWAGFAPVASLYLAEDETAEPSINRGEYAHTFFTAYNAALAAARSTPLIKKRWNYLALNKAPEQLIDMWIKCVTGRIDVVPPGLYKRIKHNGTLMAFLFRYEAVSVAGLSTSDRRSHRTTVDEMMKAEGLISATKRLYVKELEYINNEARRTRPQK